MTGSLRVIVVKLLVFAAFTLAVTGLLAAVIGNLQPFTPFYEVKAEFSDATGLLETDVVKVAGVTIGKVAGAEVESGRGGAKAAVTLLVERHVTLPRNVRASIRFRNLVGQRMVVLARDTDEPDAPPLPKDGSGVIPLQQTSPAFDLGVVFNNLQPVLERFNPDDANIVARALVAAFSGREEQTQRMIADLADLAETLGDRGPVAADLVTNLNSVVGSLNERDAELRSLLSSFDLLMQTLGGRSVELARAVDDVGFVSEAFADILAENRPGLDEAIAQLQAILAVAESHKDDLDATLANLPGNTHGLNRATTYGEWANLNAVCVDGFCESGFDSATVRGGGLPDILRAAIGGRR